MPASICSTFDFVVDETVAGGGTFVTLTNPGRAFRVVSVLVTGANTAGVDIVNATGGIVAASSTLATATGLFDSPATITVANTGFAIGDNIEVIATAAAAVTRVVIICEAFTPQPLTLTGPF